MKEIIFTLEKEHYMNGLSYFQDNFKNANEKNIEGISKDLINILNIYGVDLDKLNYDSFCKYPVHKTKIQQKYTFPDHHSILQIDSDED